MKVTRMNTDRDDALEKLGRDYRNIKIPPGLADAIIAGAELKYSETCYSEFRFQAFRFQGIVVLALSIAVAALVWFEPWRVTPGERAYVPSMAHLNAPSHPGAPGFPSVYVNLSGIGSAPSMPSGAVSSHNGTGVTKEAGNSG